MLDHFESLIFSLVFRARESGSTIPLLQRTMHGHQEVALQFTREVHQKPVIFYMTLKNFSEGNLPRDAWRNREKE
jgi:hypothetical protein